MNQNVRAVLFLIIIQTGFITAQYLSSLGGIFYYLGFYLIMPLVVTELHYRFLQSSNSNPTSVGVQSFRIGAFWIVALIGSTVMATMLLNGSPLLGVLIPDGLLAAISSQATVVVIGVSVSGLMFKDVQKVIIDHHTEGLSV